jgi:ribose 5-phosphate isomerase B
MRVILGADHGGFELKEKIKKWLAGGGYETIDVGASMLADDDDYVDFAKEAVRAAKPDDKMVLFCRNGFGMLITANRFAGVRCGLAFDEEAVRKGRTDDDINCLAVPADYIDEQSVERMIEIFINQEFLGGENYKRRIMKLENLR